MTPARTSSARCPRRTGGRSRSTWPAVRTAGRRCRSSPGCPGCCPGCRPGSCRTRTPPSRCRPRCCPRCWIGPGWSGGPAGSAAVAQTLDDRPAAVSAQPAMAFTPVSAAIPASAEATLTDVPGGTRIDVTCRYEGTVDDRDREYRLRLVSRGRPPEWLGSWPVLTGDDYRMVVVAPLPRADIDLLEVVSATGRSLLTLRP